MRDRSLRGFPGAPASGSEIAGAKVGVWHFARDEAMALEIAHFLSMMTLAAGGDAKALRGDVRLCGARDGNALEIRTCGDDSAEDRLVERSGELRESKDLAPDCLSIARRRRAGQG
jgi:hypothetical protein